MGDLDDYNVDPAKAFGGVQISTKAVSAPKTAAAAGVRVGVKAVPAAKTAAAVAGRGKAVENRGGVARR